MKPTTLLALLIAAGVIAGGWHLSKKKSVCAQLAPIPFGKVTSFSANDYYQSKGVSGSAYESLPVRGCPPKAPADLLPLIEAVVDFRNCSGLALIPRK